MDATSITTGDMTIMSRTKSDIELHVWQHIRQAGSAGLEYRELVAEAGLSFDVVLGAVLFLYTGGYIQCSIEAEELHCVARYVPDCIMAPSAHHRGRVFPGWPFRPS